MKKSKDLFKVFFVVFFAFLCFVGTSQKVNAIFDPLKTVFPKGVWKFKITGADGKSVTDANVTFSIGDGYYAAQTNPLSSFMTYGYVENAGKETVKENGEDVVLYRFGYEEARTGLGSMPTYSYNHDFYEGHFLTTLTIVFKNDDFNKLPKIVLKGTYHYKEINETATLNSAGDDWENVPQSPNNPEFSENNIVLIQDKNNKRKFVYDVKSQLGIDSQAWNTTQYNQYATTVTSWGAYNHIADLYGANTANSGKGNGLEGKVQQATGQRLFYFGYVNGMWWQAPGPNTETLFRMGMRYLFWGTGDDVKPPEIFVAPTVTQYYRDENGQKITGLNAANYCPDDTSTEQATTTYSYSLNEHLATDNTTQPVQVPAGYTYRGYYIGDTLYTGPISALKTYTLNNRTLTNLTGNKVVTYVFEKNPPPIPNVKVHISLVPDRKIVNIGDTITWHVVVTKDGNSSLNDFQIEKTITPTADGYHQYVATPLDFWEAPKTTLDTPSYAFDFTTTVNDDDLKHVGASVTSKLIVGGSNIDEQGSDIEVEASVRVNNPDEVLQDKEALYMFPKIFDFGVNDLVTPRGLKMFSLNPASYNSYTKQHGFTVEATKILGNTMMLNSEFLDAAGKNLPNGSKITLTGCSVTSPSGSVGNKVIEMTKNNSLFQIHTDIGSSDGSIVLTIPFQNVKLTMPTDNVNSGDDYEAKVRWQLAN
ncbi:MAG: hypothetical protein LBM95_00065 [Lactobacillales bacterium]|jgi:hypothetical protein|nr:hypothetical protein [Lactobacillales bacterium]